jgi:hypothetical protein
LLLQKPVRPELLSTKSRMKIPASPEPTDSKSPLPATTTPTPSKIDEQRRIRTRFVRCGPGLRRGRYGGLAFALALALAVVLVLVRGFLIAHRAPPYRESPPEPRCSSRSTALAAR